VKRLILISLLLNLANGEDFISEFEYGQMFYNNPRGVSCAKCHGKLGDGEFIASFIDEKNVTHKFSGPDIRKMQFEKFSKAVAKGGAIMPRYYLTQKEIKAIYEYIKIVNMPPDKQIIEKSKQEEIEEFAVIKSFKQTESNNSNKKEFKAQESNKSKKEENKTTDIEINGTLGEYNGDSDIDVQDSFTQEESLYDEEIKSSEDNNKNSIISTIFNSLEEEQAQEVE